jgi:hypothetical protein
MRRRIFLLAVPAAAAGVYAFGPATAPAAAPEPALPASEVASLLEQVRPRPGEDLFATVPWQTSLWEARRQAAKDGKPILLWEMDGHPLGCG